MDATLFFAIIALIALAVALVVVLARGRTEGHYAMDIGGAAPTASGGEDSSPDTSFSGRLRLFSGIVAAGIGVIVARLFSMQIISRDSYTERAESNRTRTVKTRPARGRILDRNGIELVGNRPSPTVVAEPDILNDELKVRMLASVLGMPTVAVRRKIQDQTEGVQAHRPVAIDVNRRTVAFLSEHTEPFEGITVEQRTQRNYPLGSVAAHVLGYTGIVLSDQLEASKDAQEGEIAYESGDTVGQSGVEWQYENVLAGIHGEQTVFVDASGRVLNHSDSVAARDGSDIKLTIDINIQQAAEQGLEHAMEEARSQGFPDCNKGCVVVLDPNNGEVLALASAPSYNPNMFVGGISNDDWNQLSSEESGYPLMNRMVSGLYPSASTIKPVVAFSALDNQLLTPQDTFYCTGFWTGFGSAYGQYCWEHSGHGTMNLQSGITYSCDTVFYEIGKAFYFSEHPEALQETFKAWGLGAATGIDLPSEATGRVPDAEWKRNYFADYSEADREWQGGDMTNLCIGQGYLLVTPLQIACVYMGLANGGTFWRPHLLKSVLSKSGEEEVVNFEPTVYLTPQQSAEEYRLARAGLEGVIYEESEAMTAHFTSLPVRIAGKTGTGEAAGNKDPTGWFIAYAPVNDPQYVVCAMVEEAGFGSTSAMYAVRDTLGFLYNSPDTSTAVDQTGAR